MEWPPDHPVVTDPALAPWAGEVERLCPEAVVVRLLRHLSGRRATTLVRTDQGAAVLKVFATSRARGWHRRLSAFAETGVSDLVPRPLGFRKGHLALAEFIDGAPMAELAGAEFVDASRRAGTALRRLHDSGAQLDRQWTVEDEIAQLRRTVGPQTRTAVERVIERSSPRAGASFVPSHRDFYASQVIATRGVVRFIDFDDCAMAPPGLDLGNFIAHLVKDAALGRMKQERCKQAVDAFVAGYMDLPSDLKAWKMLSLARLAALAETRHRDEGQMRRLLSLLD
jgi:hypothetical protein